MMQYVKITLMMMESNIIRERIPYLASIILISLIFILNKYEKLISLIVGLFFLFGAIISFYHFGIEQGFFSESFVCNLGNNNEALSSQDLLKELEKNTRLRLSRAYQKMKSFLFITMAILGMTYVEAHIWLPLEKLEKHLS